MRPTGLLRAFSPSDHTFTRICTLRAENWNVWTEILDPARPRMEQRKQTTQLSLTSPPPPPPPAGPQPSEAFTQDGRFSTPCGNIWKATSARFLCCRVTLNLFSTQNLLPSPPPPPPPPKKEQPVTSNFFSKFRREMTAKLVLRTFKLSSSGT